MSEVTLVSYERGTPVSAQLKAEAPNPTLVRFSALQKQVLGEEIQV